VKRQTRNIILIVGGVLLTYFLVIKKFILSMFKRKVVSQANLESLKWSNLSETDEQVGEIIADYWNRSGIYSNPDFTAQEVTQEDFQEQYPWSAVFISWIMNVSGAGNNFEYAPSHAEYILKFKENRINNQGKFKAYSIEEIKPKKSDLVCRWRQNEINYDSIQEGDLTHCDIVVDINNNGINVVGGNLDNKVKTLQLSTDNDGYVDEDKYFAIIRNEL
jgi:hypothetical protein